MKEKNVLTKGGDVISEKLESKLKKSTIDIEYLNQTLKEDCNFILDDDEEDQ